MDEEPALDARARRAIPLIAAALTVVVVAGLIYLRANAPPSVALGVPSAPHVPPQVPQDDWAVYDFISPSLGWAALAHQPAGASTVWIFRTTDGARHWQMQFRANLPDGEPPSIQFFDHLHGIVYAGRLYRTVDGGAHWDVISLPEGTPNFVFASAMRGWALAYESDPLPATHLYSTNDGGLTWHTAGSGLPAQALGREQMGILAPIGFRASGEGWIGASGDSPILYATLDGGEIWHAIAIPAAQSALPNPYSPTGTPGIPEGAPYYTTSTLLLPGNGVIAAVTDGFATQVGFVSFDRGGSWRTMRRLPEPTTFGDLSFLDAQHWWASRWGTLFKTSDAGGTWSEVQVVPSYINGPWRFDTVQVIDSKHAWMRLFSNDGPDGPSALAMTSDGGVHWTAVNVPQPV